VVPKELKNIFFMGLTRPISGGVACINEMQALFIHELINEPQFLEKTYTQLDKKIKQYDDDHYMTDDTTSVDHLTFYGFYTMEIARELDIDLKLSECRSLSDVYHYLFYPNNAFKFSEKNAW
jgi:hypothetical protein